MRSYSVILFCGVLALPGARAASAQSGSQVASAPAATPAATPVPAKQIFVEGKAIGTAEPWSAKPVGSYDLVIPTGEEMMIANVTIRETGGKLVASLKPLTESRPLEMGVTVNGTDLMLLLDRGDATITIHLQRRGSRVSGSWALGADDTGTLEGVVNP